MIRVVLYGLGPIGAGIARVAAERSDFQITGAIDVDPAKVGKDAGEVIELGRDLGVTVSDNATATLRNARADVALHATSSSLAAVAPQLKEILRFGTSVVSTCEELSYPWDTAKALAEELDRAALAHHAAILGTGINPGFAMDALPLALTAVCQRVDSVRVRRIQDAARRRLPLQKKIGAGLSVEEFEERVKAGTVRHVGLPESVYGIARALGWDVQRLEDKIEPVLATEEISSAELTVPKGRVLGVKQNTIGIVDERPLIDLELQMYLGAPNPRDHIVVEGLPRVETTIAEGTHGDLATAAIVVNAVFSLFHAPSGLRTMEEIPPVHYRAPKPAEEKAVSSRARHSLAF